MHSSVSFSAQHPVTGGYTRTNSTLQTLLSDSHILPSFFFPLCPVLHLMLSYQPNTHAQIFFVL